MLALIIHIQKNLNIPIFYVSHSLAELQQSCDKLLVLEQGKVVKFGNIHQVIHQLNNQLSPQASAEQQTSLSLPIKEHLPEQGLSVLDLNNAQPLFIPLQLDTSTIGQKLRCFIFADDISISLDEPINSSIVNHLHGEISEITLQKQNAFLTINCSGIDFYARITLLSFERLKLKQGQAVYIQFKASAVKTFNLPSMSFNPLNEEK